MPFFTYGPVGERRLEGHRATGFVAAALEPVVNGTNEALRRGTRSLLTEVDGRRVCYSEEQSPVTLDC